MQKTELSYLQNCQFHSVLLKDFLKRQIKKKTYSTDLHKIKKDTFCILGLLYVKW